MFCARRRRRFFWDVGFDPTLLAFFLQFSEFWPLSRRPRCGPWPFTFERQASVLINRRSRRLNKQSWMFMRCICNFALNFAASLCKKPDCKIEESGLQPLIPRPGPYTAEPIYGIDLDSAH